MPVSGKDVLKELLKMGWKLKSVKGSHHKLKKDGVTVIVPAHGNKDLGKGLLQKIEKETNTKF
jgi:predicted RNA binding protein YcfA (HicA-like mRNA interferase family)